jgi:DNA/RNA endonuclease G (NUC1)
LRVCAGKDKARQDEEKVFHYTNIAIH